MHWVARADEPFQVVMRRQRVTLGGSNVTLYEWDLAPAQGRKLEVGFDYRPGDAEEGWWRRAKVYGATYQTPEPSMTLVGTGWTMNEGKWSAMDDRRLAQPAKLNRWVVVSNSSMGLMISLDPIERLEVVLPYREGGKEKETALKWSAGAGGDR
jgi:hypothetical protein